MSKNKNTYQQALRECLLDCVAMLEVCSVRWETDGQRKVLINDARNLYNREDVPNYDYQKDTK